MNPVNLKQCYVDPIYFIEHNLQDKVSDPNSAYFNVLGEHDETYIPFIPLPDYDIYIATGTYSDVIQYDICSNSNNDMCIVMYCWISEEEQLLLTVTQIVHCTEGRLHENYAGALKITYMLPDAEGHLTDRFIFYDNFSELFALIKNEIKSHTANKLLAAEMQKA